MGEVRPSSASMRPTNGFSRLLKYTAAPDDEEEPRGPEMPRERLLGGICGHSTDFIGSRYANVNQPPPPGSGRPLKDSDDESGLGNAVTLDAIF